jgi:hypothetical protein
MRMWLVALAFVLPGCYRGCNGCNGSRADRCSDSTDCGKGTSCRQGYCISDEAIEQRDRCRNSDGCEERGDCTLVYKRSFLGLDPATECAATTDQECRESRACKERGACARIGLDDVGCGAATATQCAESQRCAAREECVLDQFECVRDWGTCPELAPVGEPRWAQPVDLAWDYESLRAPWDPGDLDSATLACGFAGDYRGNGALRIEGRCTAGPSRGNHTLQAGLPFHAGDAITAVIQRRARGDSGDMFVQMKYTGKSPFSVSDPHGTVECVVVPRDVALARSKRELAAVDAATASAARDKPSLAHPSTTLDAARVHAERAAKWLGWASPELEVRVTKIDAARVAFERRLDALIASTPNTTTPVNAGPYRVALLGQLCGADLRARHAASTADDCALELEIANTSKHTQYPSEHLWWLHPAHDSVAAVSEPATVFETSRPLAPGEHLTMLVGNFAAGSILSGELDRYAFAIRSP